MKQIFCGNVSWTFLSGFSFDWRAMRIVFLARDLNFFIRHLEDFPPFLFPARPSFFGPFESLPNVLPFPFTQLVSTFFS